MNVWRSLAGDLEVELVSAELTAALGSLNAMEIEISSLHWDTELSCRFIISRRHYRKACRLAEKRGDKLRIRRKTGLYWLGKRLLVRPVLLSGLLLILLLSVWLPTLMLFVRVEGNAAVPDRLILESAEKYGVRFGALRRDIRSEQVKNGLLSEIPCLQWAGVNTAGCVTTISVREGPLPETAESVPLVSSIVAARDGFVLSGTVLRGNALFRPGQTVKRGQVLISGYTDCGFSIRALRAEGDIMAQTSRDLTAVMPGEHLKKGEITETRHALSVIFRKKRINLWKDSGISDVTCGRMYEEYYITLPGGFQLPVALCIEEYTVQEITSAETEQETAEDLLKGFACGYLQRQMIAGTILRARESFTAQDGFYVLQGSYICSEMIGREQPEQIGESNGKIN